MRDAVRDGVRDDLRAAGNSRPEPEGNRLFVKARLFSSSPQCHTVQEQQCQTQYEQKCETGYETQFEEVCEEAQDDYGAPAAPPVQQDSYGSPQANAIGGSSGAGDSYGSPKAPVVDGYGAPKGPVC